MRTKYEKWPSPTCIIAGDIASSHVRGSIGVRKGQEAEIVSHIHHWALKSTASTTLWFWAEDVVWAFVHPILERYGFVMEQTYVWHNYKSNSEGGEIDSESIRMIARYSFSKKILNKDGMLLTVRDWLYEEWLRSGLPVSAVTCLSDDADSDGATYIGRSGEWRMPSAEMIVKMAAYCQRHGAPSPRPYFSIDGVQAVTEEQWLRMRPKWNVSDRVPKIWLDHSQSCKRMQLIEGPFDDNSMTVPLRFVEQQIHLSSDEGDCVWLPFAKLDADISGFCNRQVYTNVKSDAFVHKCGSCCNLVQ